MKLKLKLHFTMKMKINFEMQFDAELRFENKNAIESLFSTVNSQLIMLSHYTLPCRLR